MIKRITFIVVMVIGLSILLPAVSRSQASYGYVRGSGLVLGAITAGALVVAFVVNVVTGNWNGTQRPVVREDTPSKEQEAARVHPGPGAATAGGEGALHRTAAGEWVMVPSQTVDGIPVPEHTVWVASEEEAY